MDSRRYFYFMMLSSALAASITMGLRLAFQTYSNSRSSEETTILISPDISTPAEINDDARAKDAFLYARSMAQDLIKARPANSCEVDTTTFADMAKKVHDKFSTVSSKIDAGFSQDTYQGSSSVITMIKVNGKTPYMSGDRIPCANR